MTAYSQLSATDLVKRARKKEARELEAVPAEATRCSTRREIWDEEDGRYWASTCVFKPGHQGRCRNRRGRVLL